MPRSLGEYNLQRKRHNLICCKLMTFKPAWDNDNSTQVKSCSSKPSGTDISLRLHGGFSFLIDRGLRTQEREQQDDLPLRKNKWISPAGFASEHALGLSQQTTPAQPLSGRPLRNNNRIAAGFASEHALGLSQRITPAQPLSGRLLRKNKRIAAGFALQHALGRRQQTAPAQPLSGRPTTLAEPASRRPWQRSAPERPLVGAPARPALGQPWRPCYGRPRAPGPSPGGPAQEKRKRLREPCAKWSACQIWEGVQHADKICYGM